MQRDREGRAKKKQFVYSFSIAEDYNGGYRLCKGKIRFDISPMYGDGRDLATMKTLRGSHNHQNALAAAAAIGAIGGVLAPASLKPFFGARTGP